MSWWSVFEKEKCEMRRKRIVWIAEETAWLLTNSETIVQVFDGYGKRRRQVILGYHTTSHSSCHHFLFICFSLCYNVFDECILNTICIYRHNHINMEWTQYAWPNMCPWPCLEYVLKRFGNGMVFVSTSWWTTSIFVFSLSHVC